MPLTIRRTGATEYGKYLKVLICGDPGAGKGLQVDTPVLLPSGWARIGDLVVGDEVVGSDGLPTTVTEIFDRGVLPVYRVTFDDGAMVTCDGDHLWTVQTRKTHYTSGHFEVKSVDELRAVGVAIGRPGRQAGRKYWVPLVQPIQHDKVHLPIEPYLLGVLLANGSLGESVNFTTNDEQIARRVTHDNPQVDIGELFCDGFTARRWAVRGLHPALRSVGLDRHLSADKFIPPMYLTAHEDARRDLLAGLVDCDGSAVGTRAPGYFTTSPALADGVEALVRSLGGVTRRYVDRRNEHPCIKVSIRLPFNPFTLDRKVEGNRYQRQPSRAIVSIEPAGTAETRCIKVDAEDELFVVDHYLVTHNTRSASTYPKPLIASIGANLMSVADRGVPFAEIGSSQDLLHLRNSLDNTPEDRAALLGVEVETIIIDTFDHYQQVLIAERKRDEHKDTFAPADFGWVNDELRATLRGFRNLPMHVVFHLHLKVSEDMQTNQMYFRPSLQGALGDEVSAYVDVALAFKSGNEVVVGSDGNPQRVITRYAQTYRDAQHPWVRDNSGQLPPELEINFEDDFQRLYDGVFGGINLAESSTVHEVNESAVAAARQARIEASLGAEPPAPAPVASPVAAKKAPAAKKVAAAKKAAPAPPVPEPVAVAEPEPEPPAPEPVAVEPAPEPAPEPEPVEAEPTAEEAAAAELEAEMAAQLEAAITGDAEPSTNGHKPEAVIPEEVPAVDLPPCADCGGVIETEDYADLSQIRFRRKMCRDCFTNAKRSMRSA